MVCKSTLVKSTLFPRFNASSPVYKIDGGSYIVYDSRNDKKLSLNNIAYEILLACDGTKDIKTILNIKKHICSKQSIVKCISDLHNKNIVRFFESASRHAGKVSLIQKPFIEKIVWAITNVCNLKCVHCYQDSSSLSGDEMPTSMVTKTISDLKGNILKITLTGGEPFQRKDLFEIIDHIRSTGLGLRILTNGTLISPTIAKKLKKLNIYDLRVSLDGMIPETHDRWRRVNGSFNKAVKGIKNLLEANVNLRICTTISKNNVDELGRFPDFLIKLGIKKWNVSTILPLGRSANKFDKLSLDNNFLELFAKRVLDLSERYKSELEVDFGINYAKLNYLTRACDKPDFLRAHCFYCPPSIFIDSKGEIHPCIWLADMNIGNIKETNVGEIVRNAEIFRKLKLEFGNLPYCEHCIFFKLCGGGCRKIAQVLTGDKKGKDEVACGYFRVVFPIFFDRMNENQKKFVSSYIG